MRGVGLFVIVCAAAAVVLWVVTGFHLGFSSLIIGAALGALVTTLLGPFFRREETKTD